MKKIRKDDEVVILAGRDRGKRGKVLRVAPNGRVFVENVGLVKHHTKPNPQKNVTGGIVEKEASIHISNVMLVNGTTGKGERVGFKTLVDGNKVRLLKKSGEVADAK